MDKDEIIAEHYRRIGKKGWETLTKGKSKEEISELMTKRSHARFHNNKKQAKGDTA